MQNKFKAYSPILNEIWDCDKLILNGLYLAPSGVGIVHVHDNMNKTMFKPLQYTGWKCEGTKEIYEGDVLTCEYRGEIVSLVVTKHTEKFILNRLDNGKAIEFTDLKFYNEEDFELVLLNAKITTNINLI